jgi:membrane protein YqaA with SNARE-associated domain
MDWHSFVINYGWWALAFGAFLSATLLPLSSEALMLGGIAAGVPVVTAFVASCVGNCLGCALNYAIGAWLRETMQKTLQRTKSGRSAVGWMEKHGLWSLWGSWLPMVGDPLTFMAGAVRVNFWYFAFIVFALRIARYALTLWGGSFFVRYS